MKKQRRRLPGPGSLADRLVALAGRVGRNGVMRVEFIDAAEHV